MGTRESARWAGTHTWVDARWYNWSLLLLPPSFPSIHRQLRRRKLSEYDVDVDKTVTSPTFEQEDCGSELVQHAREAWSSQTLDSTCGLTMSECYTSSQSEASFIVRACAIIIPGECRRICQASDTLGCSHHEIRRRRPDPTLHSSRYCTFYTISHQSFHSVLPSLTISACPSTRNDSFSLPSTQSTPARTAAFAITSAS